MSDVTDDRTGNATPLRFAAVYAMLSVAFNCAEKAMGSMPQMLFSQGALWVWWLCVAAWITAAAVTLYRGAR